MSSARYLDISHRKQRVGFAMCSLIAATVLGVYGAAGFTAAHAQSNFATIFGWAPAGETITLHGSTSGVHRHSKANAKGRYSVGSLPMGTYTVTLEKDGKAVDTRSNISVMAGRGAEVDFACVHDQCAESANN